ncbi:helix-turn-helix transcriptional regulator [Kineococcus gynurae]|uniref:Helix-turn-helix transcriptional regulator n=1 Tax=Kineococcus gynurae TaxID=452979 RepID=A0ABV5LNL9_9ACTN
MARNVGGSNDNKHLYNRLAVLRAERGTTRRQLAEAVGVNVQTIGFLERGDYGPSVELALRLAGHFGLPVEAVFSLTPFPPMSAQLYPAPTAPAAPPTTSAQAGATT